MLDLTPLYRSTIGFDHLAQMLDEADGFATSAYPPYNIERVDEEQYRISMAVAGFRDADLNIEVNGNTLTVSGKKTVDTERMANASQFFHRGIASRAFERRFQLAAFVEVRGAELENGLLHVVLQREIPEAMKPRTIAIQSQLGGPKAVEDKKVA